MALHGLKDRAADWMKALDTNVRASYTVFKDKMIDIFSDKRPIWQKHKDIFSLRQQKSQSALEFAGVLRQKQRHYDVSDQILTSVFISGLEPTLSNLLAVQNPSNFTEAVETASRLETVHTTSKSCAAVGSAPLSGYEEILAALARIERGVDHTHLSIHLPIGGINIRETITREVQVLYLRHKR